MDIICLELLVVVKKDFASEDNVKKEKFEFFILKINILKILNLFWKKV